MVRNFNFERNSPSRFVSSCGWKERNFIITDDSAAKEIRKEEIQKERERDLDDINMSCNVRAG